MTSQPDHTHRPDLSKTKAVDITRSETVCIVCGIEMTVDYVLPGGSKAGGKV